MQCNTIRFSIDSSIIAEAMSAKENELKKSLVHTRQVIANKFRKLNRNRVLQEKELEAKYAPITDSINRLIETKNELRAQKNNSIDGDELENGMELDNHDVKNEATFDSNRTGDGKEKILIHSTRKFNKNPPSSLDNILISERESLSSKRKSKRTNEHDAFRFDEDELVKIATKRKFNKQPSSSLDKILTSARESLSSKRKFRRTNEHDALRFDEDESVKVATKRKKQAKEEISSGDYHCHESAKKRCKRGELTPKRISKSKVTISPDDYDDEGKFIGLAPKRRKIEVSENKLAQIRKIQRRMKERRIKYGGEGIEKKFIPYTENIVYEYYDDPNELVERLMLLVSSKSAGNTNHDQEINSIVEELRERNIIH